MTIRMFVGAIAIVASAAACGGAPEGEPTASPATSATEGDAAAPPLGIESEPGGGGKVYCPKCPIQCDPTDPGGCPGGSGGGGGGGQTRE